jgi:hypothetical protein
MATGYEASASAIYWVGGGHEAEAKTKAVQHMDRAVEVGGCMHVVQSACSYTLTQCSYTAGAHQRPCFLRSSWLAVGRSEHYIRAQRC